MKYLVVLLVNIKLAAQLNLHICFKLTGDSDYFSGPYSVTFLAGTTNLSFYIAITDDSLTEGNEQFYVTIDPDSLADDVMFGNLGAAVITIVDDDCKLMMHYIITYISYLLLNMYYC